VSITGGTITGSGTNRVVNVSALGDAIITVNADKKSSQFKFRCKTVPSPIFKIGSGKARMASVEFKNAQYCRAELENFDFELRIPVVSADVFFTGANFPNVAQEKLTGYNISTLKNLSKCIPGTTIIFDNIKVQAPEGLRTIDSKTYTLQ
jgi:hypothetical protein